MNIRFFLVLFLISFSLEARPPVRNALASLGGLVDCIRRAVVYPTPRDSELVDSFERVMTQKQENYEPISSSARHLVMSTRWLGKMNRGWIEPEFSGVVGSSSPHVRFHEILAKRIQTAAELAKWSKFSSAPGDLGSFIRKPDDFEEATIDNIEDQTDIDAVSRTMGYAFMDGQYLSLQGFTQFPKVVIAMSQSPREVCHGYFVPIEQAMLCRTLGEYRRSLALLKSWGSYSHFGLAVIPAGAYVSIRVGPVAQQIFPNVDPDYDPAMSGKLLHMDNLKDIVKVRKALSMTVGHENDYWRFCEYLHGGATQILFSYAYNDPKHRTWKEVSDAIAASASPDLQKSIDGSIERIPVYKLDGVLYDPREFHSKRYLLEFKHNKERSKPWDPDKIRLKDSHFFMTKNDNVPVAYDDIKIDFPLALKEAGILSRSEYTTFQRILRCVRP